MKELSKEQICEIFNMYQDGPRWVPDEISNWAHKAFNEAYDIGRKEAGIDQQRFEAAKAALTGYRSYNAQANSETVAKLSVIDADALIAELNRTASDAEKGGEG